MTYEELLHEIKSLTPEDQRQLIDFIRFIRQQDSPDHINTHTQGDLRSEDFVGMWKDYEPLKNSSMWVRQYRESECAG